MTTIAYKDGIMASDSRLTADVRIMPGACQKVYRCAGGLVGFSGDADEHLLTPEFLLALKSAKDIPEVIKKHEMEERDWSLLIVFAKHPRTYYRVDIYNEEGKSKSGFYSATLPKGTGIAIGSGSKVAEVAMYLGKSASDAVEVAMEFDAATGGDITEYVL